MVDKVINATKIAQQMAPEFMIDGELQGDAALVESIGQKKAPEAKLQAKPTCLFFRTLTAGILLTSLCRGWPTLKPLVLYYREWQLLSMTFHVAVPSAI